MTGEFSGEIDLQYELDDMFAQRGSVGVWMKDVLQQEGYWGYNSSCITCPYIILIYFLGYSFLISEIGQCILHQRLRILHIDLWPHCACIISYLWK